MERMESAFHCTSDGSGIKCKKVSIHDFHRMSGDNFVLILPVDSVLWVMVFFSVCQVTSATYSFMLNGFQCAKLFSLQVLTEFVINLKRFPQTHWKSHFFSNIYFPFEEKKHLQ